jgi:NiFe hydrogenase small subunit HydA
VKTLFWMQTGACGGDSMALLGAVSPSLEQLLSPDGVELLWHPSLSHASMRQHDVIVDRILSGAQALDVLCVEGSIVTGPRGSGLCDSYKGQARMDIVRNLAERAGVVVAIGTCAAFGGVHAANPNPGDCVGLQYNRATPGGLLQPEWRSREGRPVINIAGCPAHPHAITQTLAWLVTGAPLPLDALNRPQAFFNTLVHQGCTRNEYHEYDVEEAAPGGRACLFFNLGCQGPMTEAVCNSDLWSGVGSKTRAGVPCFACTSPGFPREVDLFRTEKIGDIPLRLPMGVERARYMAYKNLARAAAPSRVKDKKMDV